MKKILTLILTLILSFSLTGCIFNTLDYDTFEDNQLKNYYETEIISKNKYVLYYYNSEDEGSEGIKNEILDFLDEFEILEFYLLDTKDMNATSSHFGGYVDEPIIHVISSNQVLETYTGEEEIREFILEYSNIEFNYDLFESQHVTTYEEIMSIENDSYILYYYLDSCPHCIKTMPYFLPWAFTKSVEDIYFMEGSTVLGADDIPTELIILNSGTPILVLMSNGEFADEYYSGSDPVIEYIEEVGSGDIIPKSMDLDYDDFTDKTLDSHDDTLTISDDIHFEYFYSPTCGHCNSIKFKVLNFLDDLVDVEYYIINARDASGTPKVSDVLYVPALYIIKDNKVVDEFVGSDAIPAFINAYRNGEIDLTQYE